MGNTPFQENASRTSLIEKFSALVEVLLMSGMLSIFLAALPFSLFIGGSGKIITDVRAFSAFLLIESAITVILLLMISRSHGETIRDFGLHADRWKSHLLAGLAMVPFLFLINSAVLYSFRAFLRKYYLEKTPLAEIINTPQQLILIVFSTLIAGGIIEELQRAFILKRFSRYLGGAELGLVLWSLAFGALHSWEGPQGIAIASISGFAFGAIYLLSGSLIAPIVAHSTFNTLQLLHYWFAYGQYK
jgi:membrane protease YdiL (CAAX protease family)